MGWLLQLTATSIGKKAIMAVTGAVLFGFTLVHMSGNLLVFAGQDAFNAYAATLKGNLPLLWGTRIVLLVSVLAHIASVVALVKQSAAARPVAYKQLRSNASTYASRTMRYGGLILLAFIAFHLAHYTLFLVTPEFGELHDAQGRHDAYRMVVAGFSNPVVVGFYLLAMGSLALHLSHGAWSMFQSLGLNHPQYNALRDRAALVLAGVLTLGFSSVPLAVLSGLVH